MSLKCILQGQDSKNLATKTELNEHINDKNNPHEVTVQQIGAALDIHAAQHASDGRDPITSEDIKVISYGKEQSLTPTQQAQGQKNLGVTWPCNPNLLDNWYFGRPVNQRGETEYSPTWNGYSIDRWSVEANSELSIKIVDGGITVKNNASTQRQLKQILDNDTTLEGNLFTVSVLVSSINGNAVINYSQTQNPYKNSIGFVHLSAGLCSGSGTRVDAQHKITIVLDPGAEVTIQAIKLELGPTQTLAHQDAEGKWVLNEVPDYGEQLRRCQRYFTRFTLNNASAFVGFALCTGTNSARGFIPLPTTMRTTPTFSSSSLKLSSGNAGLISINEVTSYEIVSNGLYVGVTAADIVIGKVYGLYLLNGYIDLSADL